jgi:glycosyltransferase involved in cell wall biosynthesis
MLSCSVVVVVKNEAKNIARCLRATKGIAHETLVVDNGSDDDTIQIAQACGAKVLCETWEGYATTKNKANELAQHDWIISLDADEEMNETLRQSLFKHFETAPDDHSIFQMKRKLVYDNKVLQFGAVSSEYRNRIFNKKVHAWNQHQVHEDLTHCKRTNYKKLAGYLLHYSFKTSAEHLTQLEKYAQLSAKEMNQHGMKCNVFQHYCSPIFSFIKNYIFRFGFLDGKYGFLFAKENAWYTKRKYDLLREIQ